MNLASESASVSGVYPAVLPASYGADVLPFPSITPGLHAPLQHSFHDFARASSDWLWEVDAHDHIVAVSEQIAAIIEKPAFMLVGAPFDTLGSLEPNLSGESPYIQARPKRAPFRNQLKQLKTASGEVIYFHISGVPIFNAQGMFCGYRGAGMDVSRTYRLEIETHTARRNLEAALRALQAKNAELDVATLQAQSALTAKNEFLASMSHELRTPLNAIIGFAEAMELQLFGGLPNHYVGYARDIGAAGRHLLGLIEDILDVSVIESGEVALSYTAISLDALVARAKSLVLLRAQAKQLDLAHVEAPSNVLLHVDERRALQILVNLLTNAVKFTPAYGKIGVETCLEPTGFYKICVWDSGPGIDEQDYERVFERFEQCVGESYAGKPEGTGLGLHISRELARMMGGDLIVEQHTGAGARFALTLPAALKGIG
jgi:signal transduction histidine kinase